MPHSELRALTDHLQNLLTDQQWTAMYLHIQKALELAQSAWQAEQLLGLCLQVPAKLRLSPEWAQLLAYAAFRANQPAVCEDHLDMKAPGAAALRAWLYMQRQQPEAALAVSEQGLTGERSGIAWRMRAWAMADLHRPGWDEAFREAARHNSGRQRGIALLQLGGYLSFAGREAEARSAYGEAAPCFMHDPELRAIALYNVGTACLRLQQLPAAERAYKEAMHWAEKPAGLPMLPRAWSGLGHLYRALAELPRALHAYSVSQVKSTQPDDVAQAWRGAAHTLRLLGRLDESLATLHEALERLEQPATSALYADLAAVQVSLGDTEGAAASLRRVTLDQAEEAERARIVEAELARRAGQLETARALLNGLTEGALWVAEETRLLPELFALVGQLAPPLPPMQLQVRLDGPVRASLNGRDLDLKSNSPAASLLALLVHQGGHVPVEAALEWLDLPGDTPRRRRQNLSRVLGDLRDVLGWPQAVQTDGRSIRLDQELSCLPPQLPQQFEQFCAGLNDEWIQDWREQNDPSNALLRSS